MKRGMLIECNGKCEGYVRSGPAAVLPCAMHILPLGPSRPASSARMETHSCRSFYFFFAGGVNKQVAQVLGASPAPRPLPLPYLVLTVGHSARRPRPGSG